MFRIDTHLQPIKFLILFVGLVLWQFTDSQNACGQTIPRAGFPYCQGFLNLPSENPNSIQFTVAKGDKVLYGDPISFQPRDIKFTGQGIRLVDSEKDLRGYLFIDLPFLPTYGIKTSFEYFVHTPSTTGLGDGFSFFLFDGTIDASTFEIGGVGGSLSYAPHGKNFDGNPFTGNYNYTSGGLKGGYLGIGFDVLGNFGNYQEKKYGGFHDPNQFNFSTADDDIKAYPNAVTIRGAVESGDTNRQNGNPPPNTNTISPPYNSYQFVDGKIVKFEPPAYSVPYMNVRVANGSEDLYNNPATRSQYFLPDAAMFDLGSGLVPYSFNCISRPVGYRKVFIDLQPTKNPAIPYRISVYILKDNDATPIKIIDAVDYPYPIASDATLKLGFAASTGDPFYSAIDIRNVAALVSSVEENNKPVPPALSKEICIDDANAVEFPFCVQLPDDNTFIQCVQLMDDYEPANNDFSDDFFQCEQPGFCNQRCLESRKELEVRDASGNLIGVFRAALSEEVEIGKFNEANITFERIDMSFFGTITKYYKIVDNFGLESDAIPITIIINPKPEIIFKGTEVNPSCDGQSDGKLTGVQIGNLVNDPGKYTVEFYDEFGQTVSSVLVDETIDSNGFITATFDLENLNLGKIFVRATNPSSTSLGPVCNVNNNEVSTPCVIEDELLFDFELQQGTPVLVDPEQVDICEGSDAVLTPTIDPKYGSNPGFIWYIDENRSQTITESTTSIDGETVIVNIGSDGVLTISGLTANGGTSKIYDFYVEAASQDNGNGIGNFCPYLGEVLTKAEITVYPGIDASFTNTEDWCLDSSGSITVNASGGSGSISFSLLDSNDAIIAQNQTGVFSNLNPGDYVVEISSTNPPCITPIPVTILGPQDPLVLTEESKSEEFCDLQNGTLSFTLTGGNVPYNSILVGGVDINTLNFTQSGDLYTVSDLEGQVYDIEVEDTKGCPIVIAIDVPYEEPSEFGVIDDEICEGQTATVMVDEINVSTSSPTYTWYATDGAGGYQTITTGSNFDGGNFTFDAATNSMSVSGLAASATPYTYYLQVTGSKVCDDTYMPVDITVNFGPEMDDPSLTMVTCFGASDGSVQANLPIGNLSDFEFSLLGDNGVDRPFAANNGYFDLLPPGLYRLTIRNSAGCISYVEGIEITEPTEIDIQTENIKEPTCGEENGSWTFTVSGGTPDANGEYEISLDGALISTLGTDLEVNAPNNFTISNLSPGGHTISVRDSNTCLIELSETFTAHPIPVFETSDVTICENDDFATLSPVIVDQAGSSPVFTWAYEDPSNSGTFIDISNNDQINGATHTLVGNDLQVSGLTNGSSPYTYYLKVSGDLVCPANPIPASINVLKLPEAVFETDSVSCFGGNDGKINLISSDPSANMTFTLMETGESNTTGNFAGLPIGNYTVTVQEDGAPCNSNFSVEIFQPEELLLVNDTQMDPTCGDNNGSISFDITGGIPDYEVLINGNLISTYNFSQVGETFVVKNLAPGTYSINVVDANGCNLDRPDLFVLVNDTGIDVAIETISEEICEGFDVTLTPLFQSAPSVAPQLNWFKDSGLIEPISSNSSPDENGYIYQVSNGVLTVSGLQEGSYSYFLEISGAGICTSVEQANVVVYPELGAIIDLTNETCFEAVDGTISVTGVGGNGEYEFSINGGVFSSTNVWTDLAPGTYTISVKNDIGCTYSEDVEVTGPAESISVNEPTIVRSSCDLDNGIISDLVISGGTPAYTVEWRIGSETGTIVPGDVTGATDLAPGTYFLLVTDEGSCTAVFTFEIEESSDPVYDVVPPIDECAGNEIRIRPIHLAPDPSLPPAAATEVKWFKSPEQVDEISTGSDGIIAGVTYTIDDTDWVNPELLIEGLPAGKYTYYFYVVCTGQEIPVEIEVFDTPQVVLEVNPETCYGDQNGKIFLVSGDNPEYTYQVNSETPGTLADLESRTFGPGVYTITIATPAGCAQELMVEIDGPESALTLSPLSTVNPGCGASNGKIEATINGGWAPYEVDIFKDGSILSTQSVDESELKLDGLTIGDYYLIVTDSEGCQVISETVTLVDGPTQVLIEDLAICINETAVLIPTIDPVAPNVSYLWFYDSNATNPVPIDGNPDSNGFTFNQNSNGSLEITGLTSSGSPHYFYSIVTGADICEGFIGEGKIEVFDSPTATYSVTDVVCFGDKGVISVIASGGSGNYSYSLNGASPVSSPIFQVDPGVYEVEVVTPESCNVLIQNIEVNGPDSPIEAFDFQIGNPTCDLNNGQVSFEIQGGYEDYEIETFKDGVSLGSQSLTNSGSFSISNLAIGIYTFEVTDISGCSIILDSPIALEEVATVIEAEDQSICEGESAVLTPSVPSNIVSPNFTWYFDANATRPISNGFQGEIEYDVNSNGELTISGLKTSESPSTYYVLAEGEGICGVEPKAVNVTIGTIPTLKVSNPSIVCDPAGTVDLTQFIEGFNPSVYDYQIENPNGTPMRIDEIDAVQMNGDYKVSSSFKGVNCWGQVQRIRVLISETELIPDFDYSADLGGGYMLGNQTAQVLEDVEFSDLSQGNIILWHWDFGDGNQSAEQNPVHQFQEKGFYTVTLTTTDEIGCIAQYQEVIEVKDDYLVIIPNAFTPDGSKNIYFKPQFRGIVKMEFFIFNTWGELIYETENLEDLGWDGTLKGVKVPNGNYVYRGVFWSASGEKVEKAGVFTLIR